MHKIVREFIGEAVFNDGTNTDRRIKIRGQVLDNEEVVLQPEENDIAFELKLGHDTLSELRRLK